MSLCASCTAFDIQAFSRGLSPWMTTSVSIFEEGNRQGCSFCTLIMGEYEEHFKQRKRRLKRGYEWVHWASARLIDATSDDRSRTQSGCGLGLSMFVLKFSADPKPSLFIDGSHPALFNLHADEGKQVLVAGTNHRSTDQPANAGSPAATSGDIVGLPSVDPDPSSTSACERIRHWLISCESHQECAGTLSMTRKVDRGRAPLPTRCVRVSVANNSPSKLILALEETGGEMGEYISLSHRWSKPETELSRTLLSNYGDRRAGLQASFQNLDPLFNDVFLVASKIGIAHVWIDSLCIVQDNPEDWRAEAVKMADYYQNATMTIMAAVPPEKRAQGLFHQSESNMFKLARLPYRDSEGNRRGYFYLSSHFGSVRETLRHNNIKSNELLSRGWVFQEWALSRRIAWYTEHGLTLQCKCPHLEHRGEYPLDWDPSSRLWNLLAILLVNTPKRFWDRFKVEHPPFRSPLHWQSLVSDYSTLHLTKAEDRLIALGGIAQEYAAQEASDRPVCGLRPWCLELDLLWEQRAAGVHRRYHEFPSWSWASTKAPITWISSEDPSALFQLLDISSTPGGPGARTNIRESARGSSSNPPATNGPLNIQQQGPMPATFAPEATLNTLHIRGRLLPVIFGPVFDDTIRDRILQASRYQGQGPAPLDVPRRSVALAIERDTVAGWSSLEEPSLQNDEAFIANPIIFALCISMFRVPRGGHYFKSLWGYEEIFNVLFVRPSDRVTNGFVRVGVGRLVGITARNELYTSCESNIQLL